MVAQAAENGPERIKVVVHFLQAHDVWSVSENLLQDEVLALRPVQGIQRTLDEAVCTFTQSCQVRRKAMMKISKSALAMAKTGKPC